MGLNCKSKTPICCQITAVVLIGVGFGFTNMLGLLPVAGMVAFLACAVMITLFKGVYRFLVLSGIVLLACVFIEPAPCDIILIAAIPLGLITGEFQLKALGKASLAAGLMFTYFIVSLPGITRSIDVASALRYYLITFYLFLLSLFICTYARPNNITALLRAYVLAAFLSLAAGIAGQMGLFPNLLMMDPFRVKGLFKDPNVYGPFFVPAIVLLLDDIKRKRILKSHAVLHAVGIVLLSLGVVFSYSRAAWINLAAAIIIYSLINHRSARPKHIMRIALAIAGISVITALLLFCSNLKETAVFGFIQDRAKIQDYDKDRFGAQLGGLELAIQYPLGVSPGQFENRIAGITGQQLSAHSLYIRILAENGLPSFAAFLLALASMLLLLWFDHLAVRRTLRANAHALDQSEKCPLAPVSWELGVGISPAVFIAVFSGLLVNSLVVDTLHWRHFWFFIGLVLYRLREVGRRVEKHD